MWWYDAVAVRDVAKIGRQKQIAEGTLAENEIDDMSEYDNDSLEQVANGTMVDNVTDELSQHDSSGQEHVSNGTMTNYVTDELAQQLKSWLMTNVCLYNGSAHYL